MSTDENQVLQDNNVHERPIGEYAEHAYLEYAMSVVKGRALPAVSDGQKPVQRRILYAMNEMRLIPTAKPVKSARVVGDVLGKYHPHGDSACYEALVRIAQDFSLRYPLIDGQGNFGSRDGDGAAAMRYTECRLTPIANLLMSEIDLGTVDFGPNYDGSFEEPLVLPARLPMLLLNGASGIAVGMATEIPSHNLREVASAAVAFIRRMGADDVSDMTVSDLLEHMPGPDYPGGGQIISSAQEIRAAYEAGRGSLRVRARFTFEDLAKGQWRMIVHELPPGVSCSKVLEELEELTNPKVKAGKKTATPEQLVLKSAVLNVLETVRDESNKDQAVRLVLEPKSSKVSRDEFTTVLLAHTSLESSAPINLVSVGLDGGPGQRSLLNMMSQWVHFRLDVVRRRLNHRLAAVNHRLHILEGRRMVLLRIDEVIDAIRHSDEPRAALMERFGLTEIQADDILEIRLRQLARLEGIKIDQEIKTLTAERDEISALLSDKVAFRAKVIEEIEADAKAYGDDRRTLIEVSKSVAASSVSAPDEPVTVIVSEKGWIRSRQGHGVDPSTVTFKEGDHLMAMIACRSVDQLVFVAENGRVFTLPASAVPGGRGDGAPLSSVLDTGGSRFVSVLSGDPAQRVLLMGSHGYGFTCNLSDMHSRLKAGKAFVTVGAGEKVLPACVIEGKSLLLMRTNSKLLALPLDEIRALPKGGKGLQLIGLADGDAVTACAVAWSSFDVSGTDKKGAPCNEKVADESLDALLGRRGSRGKPLPFDVKVIAGAD